ncbi:4-hydroxy-tetrahydrodipicolinate reductase [Mucilaginibacter psychrotolerans]|uniref:4-hydroxy-tetrahydrodipicolinate reductase n=1 Tax=Mucilaginibacter psychrotolerans TaxID=1524096 RepID=A0A4Y8SH28_9SPHI|nr:4-hydroxy-tetrahydrodipicolinate reductase [Mucilaginibacter psychrotolerans]TFF37981.1 4-hydroxy-tetrahydrodipicolinate reductase [Mucilaginibacter psychrotolerans]
MKIALLGYGKMGKIIESIALSRQHQIVLKIDKDNQHELTVENLQQADVAIEFSTPGTVLDNINLCLEAGVPIVVGTTGWHNMLASVQQKCQDAGGTVLYGTNFSVGVNIFFHVNKLLAKIMNNYPYYDVQVEEIHHVQKLDSPSGTAITIAEGILDNLDAKKEWVNILTGGPTPEESAVTADQLLIESHRIDSVPGTHTVIYDSEVDTIEFKHTAHNRNGFALGAVLAAEWVQDKQGFYSVEDMFNFQ